MDHSAPRPERFRRWTEQHRFASDAVFVGVFLVAQTLLLAAAHAFANGAGGLAAVLLLSGSVAVPLRRTAPEVGFAVALLGTAVVVVPLATVPLLPLLLVAAVAVERGPARGWAASGCAFVALGVVSVVVSGDLTDAVIPGVVLVVGVLLGLVVRSRRLYVAALVDLAENLRVERDQRAEIAVAAERSRIARDMHDVVAHGLSVMIRLADGAAVVASGDPTQAERSARMIAEVGRESLADMRRALGVLRDDQREGVDGGMRGAQDVDRAPQRGIADLPALADVHRSTGLPVVLRELESDAVAPGADTVAYRIVQECLTNAARYAVEPTAVTVDVRRGGADLRITVTDDGRSSDSATSQGSERGLVGIRERAALYDGSVEAGPAMPNGWSVHVVLRGVTASP